MLNSNYYRKIDFSPNYKYMMDDKGNKYRYDDPRVIHFWPFNFIAAGLLGNSFEKRGWNFQVADKLDSKVLTIAKNIASGRECLAFHTQVGAYYKHIQKLNDDAIVVYYGVDNNGPCQSPMWSIVWDIFSEKNNLNPSIANITPSTYNNYVGQGLFFGVEFILSIIVGDIMAEARNAVRVLAKDKARALRIFDKELTRFIASKPTNPVTYELALRRWVKNISKIEFASRLEDVPKVQISAGAVIHIIHEEITDYCIENGVIPKITDSSDLILFELSEPIVRYASIVGIDAPKDQLKVRKVLGSLLRNPRHYKRAFLSLQEGINIKMINIMKKRFKKIAKKSGLVFDPPISFVDVSKTGGTVAKFNNICETSSIVGRYKESVASGLYNGMINVAASNCRPSINAQSLITSIANRNNLPLACLEMEDVHLSAGQKKILENLIVQVKRNKQKTSNPLNM